MENLNLENTTDISCVIDILDKIAIFGALSKEELNKILSIVMIKKYGEGELVFKQGGSPERVYIVKEGTVKLFKETDEKTYEIATFTIGDCFGQNAFLGIRPYFSTAICVTDACLLEIPRNLFHKLSKENPILFSKFLLNISREVCRENHKLKDRLLKETGYKRL